MKFKIVENYDEDNSLDEATFDGAYHLQKHYDEHVLAEDEQFNVNDPKFPHMTKKEYADFAEELTLEEASAIHTEDELRNARGIIGWVANDSAWRHPRNIKINTNSSKMPGFIEIVGYVDDAVAGNQIMSYMLARRGKKYREFSRKIGELEENTIENNDKVPELVG